MRTRMWGGLIVVALAGAGLLAGAGASAQAAPRASYDFEDGLQGFRAISIRDNQPAPDTVSTLEVSHEKDGVKNGKGSLSYAYNVEPRVMRILNAEFRAPEGTRSVRFWVRSKTPTALIFSLREDNGASFPLPFYVPAYEWTHVTANFDELDAEDGAADKVLNPAHVAGVSIMDIAEMLVNAPGDAANQIGNVQGPRQIWLDDLLFSPEPLPQSTGPVKSGGQSAFLVDNFESGAIRWSAVKLNVANGNPSISLFPADATLKIDAEAAGKGQGKTPLEPGGKGLRFSYTRAPMTVFGLNRQVPGGKLATADRLKLSLNCSQPSLIMVQLKKKNGAEYNHPIRPEESRGWHDLDLPLSSFTLGENSKDPDGNLSPADIKELTIMDASGFLGGMLPSGPTTLDLDAIYFTR